MIRSLRASLATALAALLLSSCWAPYYDPAVSSGVYMYRKLGSPILKIGPITSGMSFDATIPLEFVPTRPGTVPPDPVDGFLVQKGDELIRITFVERDAGGAYALAPGSQTVLNSLGESAVLRSSAMSGTSPQLVLIADKTLARQYSFDPALHQINSGATTALGSTPTAIFGLGASLLMPPSSDKDSYAVLYTDGSRNLVSMDGIDVNINGFTDQLGAGVVLDLGGRVLKAGGSAFIDLASSRFYYSQAGGPTLVWDTGPWAASSTAPTALPIFERITSLLSDGTLVAQGPDYLSAYRPDGTPLFTLPAGSVRLEHEVHYPGPDPAAGLYLIFSQVLSTAVQNSLSRDYYINVWRCPLADFKNF